MRSKCLDITKRLESETFIFKKLLRYKTEYEYNYNYLADAV